VGEQRHGTRKILVAPGIAAARKAKCRAIRGRAHPSGHRQRFSGRFLLPFLGKKWPKSGRSVKKNWPPEPPSGIMLSPPEAFLCRHIAFIPLRSPGSCDGGSAPLCRVQVTTNGLATPRGQRVGWTCLPLESHCRHPEGLFGGRSPHAGVSRKFELVPLFGIAKERCFVRFVVG